MRPNAFTSEAIRRSPKDCSSRNTMKKVLTIAAGKHFSLPFFMKATFLVKDAREGEGRGKPFPSVNKL
jgi:hypothetical protein